MRNHECKRCGGCCRELWIEVIDLDLIREPKLRLYAKEFPKRPGLYMLNQPCPFLIINPGGINHNLCSIYPSRPNICVAYPDKGELCFREKEELDQQQGCDDVCNQ
jgi:Fe-S-cluster containining protein